jgi:hypothetical protein
MNTPKAYKEQLKNKIITAEMLCECAFSMNKRAKNHRNKESRAREYFEMNRYVKDKYNTVEREQNKKKEYYEKKELLLSIVNPDCIHKEIQDRVKKIYDYEPDYENYINDYEVLHENCFYNYEKKRDVWFAKVVIPTPKYYLFYDLGTHSFHVPIDEKKLEKYPDLEVKNIENLVTVGKNIEELISVQFVDKVIAVIKSGQYKYVVD